MVLRNISYTEHGLWLGVPHSKKSRCFFTKFPSRLALFTKKTASLHLYLFIYRPGTNYLSTEFVSDTLRTSSQFGTLIWLMGVIALSAPRLYRKLQMSIWSIAHRWSLYLITNSTKVFSKFFGDITLALRVAVRRFLQKWGMFCITVCQKG